MIRTETLPDGRTHTWSDSGLRILQTDTGAVYDDAVDQAGIAHEYTETDERIEARELTAEDALRILTGGET